MNLNFNSILVDNTYFSKENFKLLNEEESLKEYFRFHYNHNESYSFVHRCYHLLNNIFKHNQKINKLNIKIKILTSKSKELNIESCISSDFKDDKPFNDNISKEINDFFNNELQVFCCNKINAFINSSPVYYLEPHEILLSNIKSFFDILDMRITNHFSIDSFETIYKENEPHVNYNIIGYTKELTIGRNEIINIFERLFKNLLPNLFNKKQFDDAFLNKNNIEYIIFGRVINFPYIMHTEDELIQFEELRKHCLYLNHAFTDYHHLQAYQITKFLCFNPEIVEDKDLLVIGRINDNSINDDVHSLYLYPVKYHDGVYEFNKDSFVCKIASTSRGHDLVRSMTNQFRSKSQSLLLDEHFFKKNDTLFEKIRKIQGILHISPDIIRHYINYNFSLYEKNKIQNQLENKTESNNKEQKRL